MRGPVNEWHEGEGFARGRKNDVAAEAPTLEPDRGGVETGEREFPGLAKRPRWKHDCDGRDADGVTRLGQAARQNAYCSADERSYTQADIVLRGEKGDAEPSAK